MYLSSSLTIDLISMILGGIGTRIIFYPSTTNSYEWFKGHNGIIVGIMETMISLGSFFFSFIGEKIINKNKIPSNNKDNLYSFEIGKRIKIYLVFQIISLVTAFILSYLLMYERKNKIEEIIVEIINDNKINNEEMESIDNKNEEVEKNDSDEDTEIVPMKNLNINKIVNDKRKRRVIDFLNKIKLGKEQKEEIVAIKNIINEKSIKHISDIHNHKSNYVNGHKQKENNIKQMLKLAIKSRRLILFSVIVILQSPVASMTFSLYREIGEYEKIDIKYLQLIGSLYFIFECLSSFIFGLLCDYIKLKYLLLFINGVGTLVGFTYCFTFKSNLMFFLIQNLISFSAGGYYPIKDCFLMQVFGKDIYIELSGYVSFLVAVSVNLVTPITYLLLSGMENKELAYWLLFISFGALNLIAFILNFFLKETPIDLGKIIR
jgi:hypothetical protein